MGLESAPELVLRVLDAFQSASDETIFGECFFEPLAKVVSRGKVGEARGIDFAIETQDTYSAYAMKSGPKIFNASQGIQQDPEFTELLQRLKKIRKQFDPVLAHGYGRKNVGITKKRRYRIASGQRFWEEITGDSDFYLKIMRVMNDYPRIHDAQYGPVWAATKARIADEFMHTFCFPTYEIDWEKLLRLVSEARG